MKTYRRMRVAVLALAIAGQIGFRPSVADPVRYRDEIFAGVDITHGLSYGPGYQRTMILYQPQGDTVTSRPLFIFAHGGYFCTGDKSETFSVMMAGAFARRGWVAASINYSLGPCLTWERAVTDLATTGSQAEIRAAQYDMQWAVRWFRANAASLGIDPPLIVVGGSSAGAITALFTHFNADETGWGDLQEYSSRTSAAVSILGAADPTDVFVGDGPILMIHGTHDPVVPFPLAAQTCAAATVLSTNACELKAHIGAGHSADFVEARNTAADFLYRRVILGEPLPPLA